MKRALAVNASLTGHLVLSSLHTNSAAGTIARLLDMKIESFLLVSTLNVIVAQRLIRRLYDTKERYKPSKEELDSIGKIVDMDRVLKFMKEGKVIDKNDGWENVFLYKPKPSPETEDGYKSRIGIHEVMKMSTALKDLIMKGATTQQIEDQAKTEGMMTMIEDGVFKAAQGITTLEEVLSSYRIKFCPDPTLRRVGAPR